MQFVYLAVIIYCAGSVACESVAYGKSRDYDSEDFSEIVRPCQANDLNCIRRFFAHNSHCAIANGPVPDPYRVERLSMPVPHGNITFTWVDAAVKGLNDGKIREFYINKATNKLVLEVEFNVISVASPNSIALYHRKGQEPGALVDYITVSYKLVSMTMTVPFTKEIEMSEAQVYTYIGDSNPSVRIGRKFYSQDNALQESYDKVLGDMATTMKEVFLVQGPIYFGVYLESNICSFRNQNLYIGA